MDIARATGGLLLEDVHDDWVFTATLTSHADPAIGEDMLRRVRRIALQAMAGDGNAFAEAARLVDTMARWLEETPHFVLAAIHDDAGRVGVRSHALAVSCLMMNFAQELGHRRDYVHELGIAGLFHDIGKLTIPQAILDKPGRLDADELARMRRHAEEGAIVLARCPGASPLTLSVCRHHHERIDGGGYPAGLSGDAVTVPMRMAAICDIYDALISQRTYKPAWNSGQALAEMRRSGQLDPDLLETFARSLDRLG